MKIAFFTNSYLPYLSGISIAVKTLKDALEQLGHTIFIVCPKYPKHVETNGRILQFPSLPATYPGYRIVIPYSTDVFRKLIKEKIDLVHCHQPFGVGLSALAFSRYIKRPLVYTYHTLFPRYSHHIPLLPQNSVKWLAANYLSWFCNQTNTIIAPSEMVRRYLVLTKVNKPIKVIATGLNLSSNERRATSNGRFSYGIPLNAKLMIYSGRIAPEKNIDYLLKAFPLIAEKQENVYLLMAGGGPQEQHYREMAKKISPRIIFTGMLEHDRLLELYGAADLFVYASITETQGLVLCEAKACGLPVVALFGGGISDMVRSGIDGYIVPRNMDVFVRHILRLLSDDNLRLQMGRQASLDAQERFSSIAVAKKMETVYNQLIKP